MATLVSAEFITLSGMTAIMDTLDVLADMDEVGDVETEVEKVKVAVVTTEVVEAVTVHLKTELKYRMSPVNLRTNIGTHCQMKQEEE